MENNNSNMLLNEGAISDFIRSVFGKTFKSSVAAGSEILLNKALNDVVRGGKKFSISTLRGTAEFKKSLADLTAEACRVKYKTTFDDLAKTNRNEAQKLVNDIQSGIEKEISEKAATGKSLIDADVKSAQSNLNKVTKDVNAGKATNVDLKAATKELKANVNMQSKWAEASKTIAGMDKMSVSKIQKLISSEAKVTTTAAGEAAKKVGTKATVKTKNGIFTLTKEQLAKLPGNIKTVIVNKKVLLALGALGLGGAAMYYFFPSTDSSSTMLVDENGNPIEDGSSISGWAPCVNELIKNKEGELVTTTGGQVLVKITTSEYPGGLQFYPNGRVMDKATKKMGKWSCKNGVTSISEVVNRVLSEASVGEVTDQQMDGYVDSAVDDLDGYVAEYNLVSLKNILNSLKGKRYNGKDAIKEFLRYYSEDERGDDFISDVQSVSVANLSIPAKNLKPQIIAMAQGAPTSSSSSEPSKTKTGIGNISITWDTDKKIGGGDGGKGGSPVKTKKKGMSFVDCNSQELPHKFGCKSTKIKEIQKCIGVSSDGKFGPNTLKALKDFQYDTSKGLTQEIYNTIKDNCGDGTEKKREITNLEPITTSARTLSLSGLASAIKMPSINVNPINIDPNTFYKALVKAGFIKQVPDDGDGKKRIKYKGPDLDDEQLEKLDTSMSGMGYDRIKQLEKDYGSKYVYLRRD